MLLLPPGSALVVRSTGLYSPASIQTLRPPTTHRHRRWSKVSVVYLSPVHFRGFRARQVSCYALFEEWLLLSIPSCCLCSTIQAISAKAGLRSTSVGTSDHRTRLVFDP